MANENRYIASLHSEDLKSFGEAIITPTSSLCSAKNKELLRKMLSHIVASQFSSGLVTTAEHILEQIRNNPEPGTEEKFRKELQDDILNMTETEDYKELKKQVFKTVKHV